MITDSAVDREDALVAEAMANARKWSGVRTDFLDFAATRYDFFDPLLAKPKRLPGGGGVYTGLAARTGDHAYPWGIERRDHDELRSIAKQLNAGSIVVLDGHPETLLWDGGHGRNAGRVYAATVRNDHVEVELRLTAEGVDAVSAGRAQLSLGYSVDIVDGFQRNTRVDHLALVTSARCGETCSIRTDCCDRFDDSPRARFERRQANISRAPASLEGERLDEWLDEEERRARRTPDQVRQDFLDAQREIGHE